MHNRNLHALGKPLITFIREVLFIDLHDQLEIKEDLFRYTEDAINRKKGLDGINGLAIGVYSVQASGY